MAIAVVGALVLALTACAGGGASPPGDSGTIKVGLDRTLTYMTGYLASSLGYLDDEAKKVGRKVQVVPFDSSSQSLAALAAGQINMDVQLAQNAARSQVQGQSLKITATLNDAGVGALVAGPKIHTPKDLEGRTVGFTGKATAAYPLLLAALAKDGVDATKVKFLTISDQSTFQTALKKGDVDAVLPGEPVISQIVAAGDGKVLYDFFDRSFVNQIMGGPYVSVTLMANGDFASKNSDATKAVTTAFVRAMNWLRDNKDNPDAVLAKLPSDFQNLKPVFPGILAHVVSALPASPNTDPAALATVLRVDKEQGAIKKDQNVTIDSLYDNKYLQ